MSFGKKCTCWIQHLDHEVRMTVSYSEHDTECPKYRDPVNMDPVDRQNIEDVRTSALHQFNQRKLRTHERLQRINNNSRYRYLNGDHRFPR